MEIAAIVTAISGFVIGLAGIVTSILTARSAAHKNDIDLLQGINDTLREEISRMSGRIGALEKDLEAMQKARAATAQENQKLHDRVHELEDCLNTMEDEIQELSEQVIALGGRPKTGPLKAKP